MRHWLIKFAPFRTSWEEIIKRGIFTLRGVRSPQACKHLADMRRGDSVLFYRSQQHQAIMGIMEVSREAYPDPTSTDPRWLTCDFVPVRPLDRPVSLAEIKQTAAWRNIALIRQPRLSVMSIAEAEFTSILTLEALTP